MSWWFNIYCNGYETAAEHVKFQNVPRKSFEIVFRPYALFRDRIQASSKTPAVAFHWTTLY